jgi:hypothetical protein
MGRLLFTTIAFIQSSVRAFRASSFERFAGLGPGAIQIAVQGASGFRGGAFEKVELVNASVLVTALFGRKVEAPGAAVGESDEGNSDMESVLQGLADSVFSFAGLFNFDEDRRFAGWMAQGEVDTAFAGLVFGPDGAGFPSVPAKLLQGSENDALGDGLFVWEFALAQARSYGVNGGLEGHGHTQRYRSARKALRIGLLPFTDSPLSATVNGN